MQEDYAGREGCQTSFLADDLEVPLPSSNLSSENCATPSRSAPRMTV